MSNEEIKELIKDLSKTKYTYIFYDGSKSEHNILDGQALDKAEVIIRQHLLDNHDKEIGELRAKVYAYEKIIANSNFAPIIKEENSNIEIIPEQN